MRLVCAIARRLTGLGSKAERLHLTLRYCLLLLVELSGELGGSGKRMSHDESQKELPSLHTFACPSTAALACGVRMSREGNNELVVA